MNDPTSDEARRAEQVAGDYRRSRPEHADLDNTDHARLHRAATVLTAHRDTGDDGFGLDACARLLAVIGEARERDAPVDADVLATAMAISAHVLELGPRR